MTENILNTLAALRNAETEAELDKACVSMEALNDEELVDLAMAASEFDSENEDEQALFKATHDLVMRYQLARWYPQLGKEEA